MEQKPKVLVLLGSPRKNMFSETLAEHFLAPLEQGGCEITRLRVSELSIKPCTGCEDCQKTGVCILKDDMSRVYEALDSADWVVLVSPIYFNSVSGSLKILIDRCQVYWARKFVLKRPRIKDGRMGFLLMSAGIRQTAETLNGSKRVADFFFKAQDIVFKDTVCIDRTDIAKPEDFEAIHKQAAETAERALASWST